MTDGPSFEGGKLATKLGVMVKDAPRKVPKRPFHIAVVGATGVVGRETLAILQERRFPVASLKLFASERSKGEKIEYANDEIEVEVLSEEALQGLDLVFFAAGGSTSKQWVPKATAAGAVCIDKSSVYRMDPEVPLVVPEVNGEAIAGFKQKRVIATPNCSTTQMVQCLAPLHKKAKIKRVVVCTYQAVSGAGKGGVEELERQVRDMFNMKDLKVETFDQRIAFNVLPRIPAKDPIPADGTTGEEKKMIEETRKILGAPHMKIAATCVRVPVFNSHSEALHVEFESAITVEEARALLAAEPNVLVVDDPTRGIYPTAEDASGEDKTLVGRIRVDESVEHGLAMWIVSDNLRTGAALNAVRIAEALCAEHLA
jgi:aspartate-semialdehyde dehydrogenase